MSLASDYAQRCIDAKTMVATGKPPDFASPDSVVAQVSEVGGLLLTASEIKADLALTLALWIQQTFA